MNPWHIWYTAALHLLADFTFTPHGASPPIRLTHLSVPHTIGNCGWNNQHSIFHDNLEGQLGVQWPWTAEIRRTGSSNCTGLLISQYHVLTLSSCVTKINAEKLTVRLGPYELSQNYFVLREHTVSDVFLRGRTRDKLVRHDIALLRMTESMNFDLFTGAVCLPQRSAISDFSRNPPSLNGWALAVRGSVTQMVPIWAQEECEATYFVLRGRKLTDFQFCAGFRYSDDSNCQAGEDSIGDPLMVQSQDGRWVLIGMAVSSSNLCNQPRIYTRIDSHFDWIKQIMALPPTNSSITQAPPPTSTTLAVAVMTTPAPELETITLEPESETTSTDLNIDLEMTTEAVGTTEMGSIIIESMDETTEIETTTTGVDESSVRPFVYTGCGVDVNILTRIVGGETAVEGKWPWMVALIRNSKYGLLQYCGGVLISQDFVLTAAHCVKGKGPKDIRARLGEHDFLELDGEERDHIVSEIMLHERYNDKTFEEDIALLRLRTKVTYNKRIQPICLPPPDSPSLVERASYIAGWGHTSSDGKWSPILREVSVPIWNTQECKNLYGRYGLRVTDSQLCAGYDAGGKDSCQGDSGGPLMMKMANGQWNAIGVVSWGIGCAEPNFPGIYTRTSSYWDWIQQRISPEKNGTSV